LAIAIRLEKCEHDVELTETCSAAFALIAQALILPKHMDECLSKVEEISHFNSWSSRLSILSILQVLVFHNMPIFISKADWIKRVKNIVLRLLEDNVLEVRLKSGEVLAGLIHCSFLPETEELMKVFVKKCKTKMTKENGAFNSNDIKLRHSGVLGLCAFVAAHPYDLPAIVPQIFEILSNHANDPPPIPVIFFIFQFRKIFFY
jgi:proteasome activator subunit 4